MATSMHEPDWDQMSELPDRRVGARSVRREVIHAEPRFDGILGHSAALTAVLTQRLGRFELANRGILFLDEIGDLPLELQPKLLRVLQDHAFEHLGSSRTLRMHARVVAATHRDWLAMVQQHTFRANLS